MAMKVFVWSRAEIEAGAAEGADAVISVRGRADRWASETLDTALAQVVLGDVEGVLILRFDDVGVPRFGAQLGASSDDVASGCRALRARQPDATLAIHTAALKH